MERIESKVDSLEERVESIDRKLDRLLYEVTGSEITDGMGKRLGRVEKTIQEDIMPWKYFVQKAVIVLSTLVSVLAVAGLFL